MLEGPPPSTLERPDLYVLARFLDRLWRPDGYPPVEFSRAKLQMAVRLNYDLFRRYLGFLVERGFVEVGPNERGDEVVRLSQDGREAHARLVGWIRDAIGTDRL